MMACLVDFGLSLYDHANTNVTRAHVNVHCASGEAHQNALSRGGVSKCPAACPALAISVLLLL